MPSIYKFFDQEITLNATPNDINSGTLIRLCHDGGGSTSHLITQKYANGATYATFTILAQSETIIEKQATDKLVVDTGSDVTANRIAYKN
jgi:hypothetical protein